TSAPAAVAASASGRRSLGDLWRMSRAISSADMDVMFFPTVYSYVPVFCRAKKVIVIHDVIAEKFPHLTTPRLPARLFWRAKVALGRRQADAIVTISEHSRRGIADYFRIPRKRIHVVGEAGDPVFRRLDDPRPTPRLEALGLAGEGRTVVYVGGFNPHKNLETLVDAFARIASSPEFSDVRLVLVGEYEKEVFHSYSGVIRQRIESLGVAGRVVWTGFLADEDLNVLLNRATLLALPSLLEGFGLPAVEAAACGCPVVATTESPLPELLGEGGRYVAPLDQGGWERELAGVLRSDELRRRMGVAGVAAANRLTWDAAARQLLAVLEGVVAR
ncbi:MAG TPA: glycosyltransferase family 1 protein, partial [Gemmataceae bacterium]|nr:glycosyltransferase family 1 protein [Gemmataceae bacterium]